MKRYAEKHPEVNQEAVKRYTEKTPEVHQKAANRYQKKKRDVNRKTSNLYQKRNPDVNLTTSKRYTERNPYINNETLKLYYAKKRLSYSNENDVINKLTDKIGKQKRLEAEKIVKWVLERRKNMLNNYCKILDHIQNKISISMEKMESLSSVSGILEKFILLAEESKH